MVTHLFNLIYNLLTHLTTGTHAHLTFTDVKSTGDQMEVSHNVKKEVMRLGNTIMYLSYQMKQMLYLPSETPLRHTPQPMYLMHNSLRQYSSCQSYTALTCRNSAGLIALPLEGCVCVLGVWYSESEGKGDGFHLDQGLGRRATIQRCNCTKVRECLH